MIKIHSFEIPKLNRYISINDWVDFIYNTIPHRDDIEKIISVKPKISKYPFHECFEVTYEVINTKEKQILEEIKEIIDKCRNCCVEPPAIKFKCPECKEEMVDKIKDIVNEVLKHN